MREVIILYNVRIFIKNKKKKMGCGAICGNDNETPTKISLYEVQLKKLLLIVSPNSFLSSAEIYSHFMKNMQLHPHQYHLLPTPKLIPKQSIRVGILQKWKIILFGLDCDKRSYVNCLGYSDLLKQDAPMKKKISDEMQGRENQLMEENQNVNIFQHKCFPQIQKDLNRTFQMPLLQKEHFSFVLKRISNHFPTMGYTQGINFIVGYLLVIGYSKNDAFWLFIHIALNKRFLLLGLYEDNFPLSNAYTTIFKNMLKRQNSKLYEHLYNTLCLDQSIWVFKWFITFYLYSFPIELCQFIWDYVLSVGGIGLIIFAVSLINNLEKEILKIDDPCDASQFFQSLKSIDKFNQYLNLDKVLKNAYSLKIRLSDLEGLDQLKDPDGSSSFYAQYILLAFKEENLQNEIPESLTLNATDPQFFSGKMKSEELLEKWYKRLKEERIRFIEQQRKEESKDESLILYLEQTNRTQENMEIIDEIQDSEKSGRENPKKISIDFSEGEVSFNLDKIMSLNNMKKKNEVEDQEQKKDKYDLQDSLCYLSNAINFKKDPYPYKISKIHSCTSEIKNSQTKGGKSKHEENNHMAKIGKNILNSLSASQASNCSQSSQKGHKGNNYSGRYCKICNQNEIQNFDDKFKRSGKNKVYSKGIEDHQTQSIERLNSRKKTYGNDWLTNSHGPNPKHKDWTPNELNTEVEIIQGDRMFKKKNKGQTGIGDGIGMANASQKEVSESSRYVPKLSCEESFDSLFIGNISSQKSSIVSCEIESIK